MRRRPRPRGGRPALVAAFTDPARLARWWGPQGSTNRFEVFDPRPGGEWRFVMRAADGSSYPRHERFVEVVAPERLVLEHVQTDHHLSLRMTFAELGAHRTRLELRMRFQSPAEAARVRDFVLEANEQNFDRLEAVLGLPASRPSDWQSERTRGPGLRPAAAFTTFARS